MMTSNQAYENSITVFRSLISKLDLSDFTDSQLYDLGSIASESAEGLCHGLLGLSESLENSEVLPPEGISAVSGFLKATAHLLPMLLEISEKANSSIGRLKSNALYSMN